MDIFVLEGLKNCMHPGPLVTCQTDTLSILPAFRETLLLTLPILYVGLLFGKSLNSFVQAYGPHSKTNKPQTSVTLTWEN